MRVTPYAAGLGCLPLFNPDLESRPPQAVIRFREALGAADALVVASPEYAHGISGVLKNALDWLVSFEGFIGKPVALINTSPRAHHAYDATLEVLKTMSANVVQGASISLPLLGRYVTEAQILGAPEIVAQISQALTVLEACVRLARAETSSFPIG
jgi:chromate reductase, NAD(P)H dehydrogenase (quinone)